MTEHPTDDTRDERTIADIVAEVEPMGDLRRFVIEDLSSDEEDAFFSILRDA
jgi:hypothetical protein